MITRAELLDLLANPESSGLEFKRDSVEPRALAKELVAFANLRGGTVLLGVDDDGNVVGLTQKGLEEWVMAACRDKIRPGLIPHFEIVREVEPGMDVAVVRVERGYTVHSLWHNNGNISYIRVGSTSREASREELARLFQQRREIRPELSPVSGTSLESLDLRRLSDYFKRVREQRAPAEEDTAGWERLLVPIELLAKAPARPTATVAGLLLFGNDVNRYLPQAGIDAFAFPGEEKDYGTIERADLRGPLVALHSRAGRPVESGLVEDAVAFVRRNTRVTTYLEDEVRRVERRTYPDKVIREAVVNALVHRDYLLSGSNIELSIYADRLEIISPGRLPNGVTPESMRIGDRATRNELLKDVMRDYGYVEHMGMGIPRTVIRGMREHNGTEPDLIEQGERFVLRLHG